MEAGPAVIAGGDVTDRAQHFGLFADLDLPVVFDARSNQPTVAFSKAPIAVSDAAASFLSLANLVSAANASSPLSSMTTWT
jgi:hypothetical protein